VLASVSRLIGDITDPDLRASGQRLRAALAAYREKEDLVAIGAYQRGSSPVVDATIALREDIERFLCQAVDEPSTLPGADAGLHELARELASWGVDADADQAVLEPAAPELPAGVTPPIPTLLLGA
jgi:flagellum-specific ATP synthase